MSYIDTIDHELVGFFAGLPVYHPLATMTGDLTSPGDFACSPMSLVIGGGGGEHPGLVLLSPSNAVARFIDWWLADFEDQRVTTDGELAASTRMIWQAFADSSSASQQKTLHFAGWGVHDHQDFYLRCTSNNLNHPYDDKLQQLEEWLMATLGEFVFFSMPELTPDIDEKLPQARYHIGRPLFMNILVPPTGYNPPFGRKIVDGKIVWGNVRR